MKLLLSSLETFKDLNVRELLVQANLQADSEMAQPVVENELSTFGQPEDDKKSAQEDQPSAVAASKDYLLACEIKEGKK